MRKVIRMLDKKKIGHVYLLLLYPFQIAAEKYLRAKVVSYGADFIKEII